MPARQEAARDERLAGDARQRLPSLLAIREAEAKEFSAPRMMRRPRHFDKLLAAGRRAAVHGCCRAAKGARPQVFAAASIDSSRRPKSNDTFVSHYGTADADGT